MRKLSLNAQRFAATRCAAKYTIIARRRVLQILDSGVAKMTYILKCIVDSTPRNGSTSIRLGTVARRTHHA
eukprot:5992225-Pleurochrysis_carterae.AAC.1